MPADEAVTATGFLDQLLGPRVRSSALARRFLSVRVDYRVAIASALLATLVFVPFLGAVGLWDPWETHYGEVAREMIQRNDYVYPYWESGWFFSKVPLTMWMQALGMQLVRAQSGDGALGLYTEWGMRLPFALSSIVAVALLSLAAARLAGARVGLATGFILSTTPLYFLMTRQTVTDTPLVTAVTCAMACALIAQLDPGTRHRSAWWYGFYVCCGLGVLAKGLLGLLPAALLFVYALVCFVPYDAASRAEHWSWLRHGAHRAAVRRGERPMPLLWGQLYRMRFLTGVATLFAVMLPWYLALILFEGVDDEGKTFFARFFIHDHFNRLAAGVHTTTPGGSFSYFIEQAGYALFPWVALVPGAFWVAGKVRLRDAAPREQLAALALLWTGLTFLLIGMSATKFHHYLFPLVPGLAVLMALYVDRLWRDGVAPHAGSLLFGFILLVLVAKDLAEAPMPNERGALYGGFKSFTDLFVYNYDRPYPVELLNHPLRWMGQRPVLMGELLGLPLVAAGAYLLLEGATGSRKSATGRVLGSLILLPGLCGVLWAGPLKESLGAAVIGTGVLVAVHAGVEAWLRRRVGFALGALAGAGLVITAAGVALTAWVKLPDPWQVQTVGLRIAIGVAFVAGIAVVATAALLRSRFVLFGSFAAAVLTFALWFNWVHWVALSHHWTQRDLFWRYYDRRRPGEPIAAYLMNWRGETFYSRNTVRQIPMADATRKIQLFVAPPGREWVLVEHQRLAALRSAVGAEKTVTPVDKDLNNKFLLVAVD